MSKDEKIGSYDSKISAERVEEPLAPDAEVIEAELVDDTSGPRPPEPPDGLGKGFVEDGKCPLCKANYHDGIAITKDEYGMLCPGPKASKKAIETYLMLREFAADQVKIDDLDLESIQKDAQEAYEGRKRSGVTLSELQADIDMRLGRLRPKMKLRENLTSDGPDFDIPHLTVPGRVPAGYKKPIKVPDRILTQREQAEARLREATSRTSNYVGEHTPTGVGHLDAMPNASEVPPEQRGKENDYLLFIKEQHDGR